MKKILIYIIFYLFCASTLVFAAKIENIEIKNNKRISKGTITTYGKIKINKDYNQNQLNLILKNLYDTNFFENISLAISGNTLIIDVKENKIIQSVKIEGVKADKIKEAILKDLFSKDKAPFLIEKVKNDKSRITTSLNYQGYYLSTVEAKTIENSNDTVDLIFVIDLGEKSKISKIEFIGDKKVKDRTLRSVILSEESKFWKFISRNKYVNESRIERDKRLLKNFYLNKGYYDINIESATIQFSDDSQFKLTYKINAGKLYTINNAKLILPVGYDENNFIDVNEEIKKLVNERYSLNRVTKVVDEIDKVSLSREYDFINANITESKVNKDKLDLIFTITESEKFYIERINIFGNNITLENVIRNQLIIDEGDPFNELLNAKSINNLKSSGLFAKVESDIKTGSSESTKVIDITVEERPTGEITVGAGVGTDGGSVGFAVTENNFLGKAIKLGTSLRITDDSITGSFSVVNPNFNYTDKSLSTTVESSNIDKMSENGYETTKTGFSFGTGFEQYENVYFSPTISNYYEDLTTSSKASDNLKKQSGTYVESKFSYVLDYDMRNQRYQTFDGFRSNFSQSVPIYSDEYALTSAYDYKVWQKFPNEMVSSLNFFGKMVNSMNGEDVRITNRFFLPRNKLRGFKTTQIGPVDGTDYVGGNYTAAVNFDTTLPMLFPTLQNIDVRYFIDVANLWGVDYSNTIDDSNKIRSSTGFVVDWFTVIGPLNFSLAQDISKVSTDKTESFQFNLGTTF